MNRLSFLLIAVAFLFCGFSEIATAQPDGKPVTNIKPKEKCPVKILLHKEYKNAYTKERFDKIDKDDNEYLDKEKLKAEQRLAELYSDKERFCMADTDNDGRLSYEECKAQVKYEKKHHRKLEKQAKKDAESWAEKHSKKAKFAKEHPKKAIKKLKGYVKPQKPYSTKIVKKTNYKTKTVRR
jgi:hypothetical protein